MLIIHQDNSFIKRVKLSTELSWIWNTRILSKEYCFFVIFVVPFTIDLKLLPIYMYQYLVFTISVYYKPFYSVVSFHTCCTKQIYNQLQKYLRQCTLFWLNGLSMILCLWSPLLPLSKLLAIKDHGQNLEEQLWKEERREVSIISHTLVWLGAIWNKKGRFFIGQCLNIFATGFSIHCTYITTKICTCNAHIVNESEFKL